MMSRFTFFLIGVTVGMLIAPDKSSSTRRRLSDLVDDTDDKGAEIVGRLKTSAKRVHSDFKGAARDIRDNIENNWK